MDSKQEEILRTERIKMISKIVMDMHHDTFVALAESERKELEHTLEMAEHVWQKVKGYPIPDCYSEEDRLSIFERYYHRAVSQSQGE